jgi:flagellin
MIINHNVPAMNAHRSLIINAYEGDKNMEKLSSGMRINRGADDAAGLAVSEKMRSQIRGLSMAARNAQDGVSLIQTAEGFLQETTSALQRIRELGVQAANGVYTAEDRLAIQTEVGELMDEIDRIAHQAEFNKLQLFYGDYSSTERLQDQTLPKPTREPASDKLAEGGEGPGIRIHVGANMDQFVRVYVDDMSVNGLGLSGGAATTTPGAGTTATTGATNSDGYKVDVTTIEGANRTLAAVDKALAIVNKQRTDLGAMQNRMETALRGIEVAVENLQSAESRVRDTDMADQMIKFVRDSILTQSATSMLAQANLRPQVVLRLLG